MNLKTFSICSIAFLCIVLLTVSSFAYYTPFYRDQTNVNYIYPGYRGNEWSSGYGSSYASYGYYRPSYSYSYSYYPTYYSTYPNYYATGYAPYYTSTPYYYATYDPYPYTDYRVTTGNLYYNPQYNSGRTFYLAG